LSSRGLQSDSKGCRERPFHCLPPPFILAVACQLPIERVGTGDFMYCYLCQQEHAGVMAVALCRRCGGAVCLEHAYLLHHSGTLMGLFGVAKPHREHVCQWCFAETRCQVFHKPASLPLPEDQFPEALTAIQSAEALLHRNQPPTHLWGWHRLWHGISLVLAHWFWSGGADNPQTAPPPHPRRLLVWRRGKR
jgi:hypothetical protein